MNKILMVGALACLSAVAMAQSDANPGNASAQGQSAAQSKSTTPRDAASGLPTGKRMHKPVTITQDSSKGTATGASADRESSTPSVSEVVLTKPATTTQGSSKATPAGGSADRESSAPSVSEIVVTKPAPQPKPVATGDLNGDGSPDRAASKNSGHATESTTGVTGSAGRESSQPSVSEAGVAKSGSSSGTGTKDAATGQSTGKRQHDPVSATTTTRTQQKPKK